MLLIYLSAVWVIGIFLGARLSLLPVFLLAGLVPLPLLFIIRRHRKQVIMASLGLFILFGAASYYQLSQPGTGGNLHSYNGQAESVTINGTVLRDPEVSDQTTRLYFSAREIQIDGQSSNVSGNVLLFVPRYPVYHYGNVLLVTGKLETPSRLDDFDYPAYLAHQGIYSIMFYPQIQVQAGNRGSWFLVWVYSLRNRLSQAMAEVLPEPQASLAQGIVLGIRSNIPSPVRDEFTRTGTTHILAISGLHLTIVAGILLGLGIWLFGRRHYIYIWLALGVIWIYALLTGMHPPVLRAAIMASLFLMAELLGRQRSGAVALALAAAIMVGIDPPVLWDASFQMSFLSMMGLVLLFPPIQSVGRRIVANVFGEGKAAPVMNFVIDSLGVSLAAVIAVWPLIAYYFGIVSFASPLATFFAVLALPGIIITGVLAGSLALVAPPLAQVVGWLAWLFISYLLLVVRVFDAVPPLSIGYGSIGTAFVLVYYSALVLFCWLGNNRSKLAGMTHKVVDFTSRLPRKWVIPSLLVVAALTVLAAASMPDGRLHVGFLDVGQGDAILIQRGSQQVLIDGGPSPQAIGLELGKRMPFWDRTIELVVLTHPHPDHLAGLVEVLKRYKVRQVLYPDLAYSSPLYDEWLDLIEQSAIPCSIIEEGQQINLKETIIEVLGPDQALLTDNGSDINSKSVVLRLEADKVSFLLTGDIVKETELGLIGRRADLASTVLKVAHHGSSGSTGTEFLAVVNPEVAVISVGSGNPFGHPTNAALDRLRTKLAPSNIYRTDENGTIEFITDGEKLWVKVEK
ncbi:MAG: DNA internalization-related competence protein ComEC/Rec2 [Chloroflexota bacterium]